MKKNFPMTQAVKTLTGSRKREFRFYTTAQQNVNVYWDGGSRSDYEVLNMKTGKRHTPSGGTYPWTTPNVYVLQPGDLLIETGVFMGKPRTPCIACRPEDEADAKAMLGIQASPTPVLE